MRILFFIAVAGLAAGCDSLTPSDFEPEVVVESYLSAGDPLPEVRLSRTIPLEATYEPDRDGVSGASVRIELLTETGSVEHTYSYHATESEPGVYLPAGLPAAPVRPLRTYRLVAEIPDEPAPITAITTVPGRISVLASSADSVAFQSEPPFTFELSRPEYPGRQSYFVFSTRAAEAAEEQLTPFARALYEDGDVTLEELSIRMSPVLNEENFEETEEGSLRIQFPWLGIYFFGQNQVIVQTIDDNLHDFIRSQAVQQGGSTRPPGEIPNVLEHVEGGRGVFGSFAGTTVGFVVLPED